MPFECMKVSLLIIRIEKKVRYRYAERVEKPTPAAVSKKENLVCEVKTAVYMK